MPTPGEHKTVQSRILAYAKAIGWTIVSREDAERRRGFDPEVPPADRARNRSLFLDDLLDAKVRESVEHLRNRGKFFDLRANRCEDNFHTLPHELMTECHPIHYLEVPEITNP